MYLRRARVAAGYARLLTAEAVTGAAMALLTTDDGCDGCD
jgi:hypothetical protein